MSEQWLLFDADNTLFDFTAAEANALRETFWQHGLPFSADIPPIYKRINQQTWEAFERGELTAVELRFSRFKQLFATLSIKTNAQQFGIDYLMHLAQRPDLLEGAIELLETLKGQYRLALITNGLQDVQRPRLALSGLDRYFEAIVVSDEVGAKKPEPAIFETLFAAIDHPPKSQAMIIGDSLSSDMQGGINFGIDTCWYNPTHKPLPAALPVTYIVHSLSEIPVLLAQREKHAC